MSTADTTRIGASIASFENGVKFESAGDLRAAASAFLMAFALDPHRREMRTAALRYLNLMSGYSTLPPLVIAALETCIEDPDLNLQPLSLVVRNLFEGDPRFRAFVDLAHAADRGALEPSIVRGDHDWILNHRLLRAVLSRAINISPLIERGLTALRRHVCLEMARSGEGAPALLASMRPLFAALAQQCVIARFAWVETPEETDAVETLSSRSDAEALLIRAAYRPLDDVPEDIAARLPPALAAAWRDRSRERKIAAALPQLTPISEGLSTAQRTQYEAFPYPRWQALDATPPRAFAAFIKAQAPGIAALPSAPGPVEILSAGCGTGNIAISLARAVPDARVTAVDLSRASLAYGSRMAESAGVRNIAFGVADILKLASLERRFHLIESSGVLHHMADVAEALKVLRALLVPGGIMRIALYSTRGRRAITAARAFVTQHGFTDSVQDMRAARQAILALPQGHPARPVADTPDFFSLDGLHDLIFNVHELHFTPSQVKDLLADAGLTVRGVDVANHVAKAAYFAENPAPQARADLDRWDDFETRHPATFAEMIHVWCQA